MCSDSKKHMYSNIPRHERTSIHQELVVEAEKQLQADAADAASEGLDTEPPSSTGLLPLLEMIDSGTRNLLLSLSRSSRVEDANQPEHAPGQATSPIEGWGMFEANEETDLAMSLEQQGVALIAQSLLDRFDELSVGSADDDAERSVVEEDAIFEPILAGKC